MTMSLLEQKQVACSFRQIQHQSASFSRMLAAAGSLLLADAGYIDRAYFSEVNTAGSFYLVRGSKNLNPKILGAWRDDGRVVSKLVGMSLKEAGQQHFWAEVLDMDVKSGNYESWLL